MAPEIFSDMDRLIDFLNGKAKIWSFGKLLSEIYKGSIPIHTKLTDQLTVYTLGSRTDAGFEDIRPQTARKCGIGYPEQISRPVGKSYLKSVLLWNLTAMRPKLF